MGFGHARGDGGKPDVIMVDTSWGSAEFFAHQIAKQGLNVHAFTPFLRGPRHLRFGSPYRSHVEEPLGSGPSASLAAMVERIGPACIIPCTEDALYWMWDQPGHIQELCLPRVPPALRPLLLDRALLLEEAAGWGVSVPTATPLNNPDDCRAVVAAGLPLMVKASRSIGSTGVVLCRTADEVSRSFEKFSAEGLSVSAQRFYVGPTYLAGALFIHGEAVHFYAGEKTVVWPPLTGYSFVVESAAEPHLSALQRAAETVCKNLEYTGVASFDFVLDEEGEFRFVDFNPRGWGCVDATIPARVDLFGGLARWIRDGAAGPPTRSVPGISHRVFPKYTFEPSGTSLRRRLMGLRDAPWGDPLLILSETVYEIQRRTTRRG